MAWALALRESQADRQAALPGPPPNTRGPRASAQSHHGAQRLRKDVWLPYLAKTLQGPGPTDRPGLSTRPVTPPSSGIWLQWGGGRRSLSPSAITAGPGSAP
ncbi:unnamed protein product [Rangifer tarandus platyrhynchus]|uniref:Uncharacterized protein n=2 Tax=Rangifer tarandus platyrhynchus TaxID=3082113 RepID=A0ACB0F9D5_RANTA|nr:unnamed protein product [Rangifer tarandus platyrhynchus]CAI9708681.1 unnamed protein product [Rangifer tarandus platyrhynchus]